MNDINILVIDDQYGSSEDLSNDFLEKVGAITSGNEPIEGYPYNFIFHSGQDENKRNSIKAVEEKIKEHWPAADESRWALVLLDARFDQPGAENDENFGFELLNHLRQVVFYKDLPIVMLTSEDEIKKKRANKAAADDYLPKNTLSRQTLEQCVIRNGLIPDIRTGQYRLVGHSLLLLKTLREARSYALDQRGSRIIFGETGSGKTELARYIHDYSSRTGQFRPWTVEKTGDITITKDKLFGHWKGAHSESKSSQAGEIEYAHEGTFLLDEVAYLSQEAQQLIIEVRRRDANGLRTLSRLGNFPSNSRDAAEARRSVVGILQPDEKIKVDILFLSATNQDLKNEKIRESFGFRTDLLNELGIDNPFYFPNLNERLDDIPYIFSWMVSCIASTTPGISEEVMEFPNPAIAV